MTDYPITPPPELVEQWCHEDGDEIKTSPRWYQIVATKAARWGADHELEACIEWLDHYVPRYAEWSANFRAARRPKSPSLKEQALEEVGVFEGMGTCNIDIIRRALDALPD